MLSKFDGYNSKEVDESLTINLIDDWVNENIEDLIIRPKKIIKSRTGATRIDYSQISWGSWLDNPNIFDPSSKISK
jgi:hypothetical protein